jgi:hypothetical protein
VQHLRGKLAAKRKNALKYEPLITMEESQESHQEL